MLACLQISNQTLPKTTAREKQHNIESAVRQNESSMQLTKSRKKISQPH